VESRRNGPALTERLAEREQGVVREEQNDTHECPDRAGAASTAEPERNADQCEDERRDRESEALVELKGVERRILLLQVFQRIAGGGALEHRTELGDRHLLGPELLLVVEQRAQIERVVEAIERPAPVVILALLGLEMDFARLE
jgi:hypothetical protein